MTVAVPYTAPSNNSAPGSPADGLAAGCDLTWTLMDAALERLEAARGWDEECSAARVDTHRLDAAVPIIVELRATLDLHRGGAIAANVDDLYDYMCRRLKSAGLPNGIAALDEVSHLLHALRSAWAFVPPEVVRAASGN